MKLNAPWLRFADQGTKKNDTLGEVELKIELGYIHIDHFGSMAF
jgi:hypothetical protein